MNEAEDWEFSTGSSERVYHLHNLMIEYSDSETVVPPYVRVSDFNTIDKILEECDKEGVWETRGRVEIPAKRWIDATVGHKDTVISPDNIRIHRVIYHQPNSWARFSSPNKIKLSWPEYSQMEDELGSRVETIREELEIKRKRRRLPEGKNSEYRG